jgi:hypothetical protein
MDTLTALTRGRVRNQMGNALSLPEDSGRATSAFPSPFAKAVKSIS